MILRRVQPEDSKEIYDWRNDPISRLMSLDERPISKNAHEEWFSKSLQEPSRILLMGIFENQKVGICRFDFKPCNTEAEVSINLNPLMRGKKLSSLLLSLATETFKKNHSAKLIARVKKENVASQKIFSHCGFKLCSDNEGILTFELR